MFFQATLNTHVLTDFRYSLTLTEFGDRIPLDDCAVFIFYYASMYFDVLALQVVTTQ